MIVLHGGGDNPATRQDTFGRFLKAAITNSRTHLALIVAEQSDERAQASYQEYQDIFASLSDSTIRFYPVLVSPTNPLTRAVLEQVHPSGVFVCGGVTPTYHQSLCVDTSWVQYLHERRICYAGTSAGAAIAADRAILGGWQTSRHGQTRAVLFQGASEGLDLIRVEDGLGLVPFSVDVHAGQMGTLTRLIQAVELGMVREGWAIDENTILEIEQDTMTVYGEGHVYHVWKQDERPLHVQVYVASDRIVR